MNRRLIATAAAASAASLAAGAALVLPLPGAGALTGTTTIDFEVPMGGSEFIDADQYTADGITITGAFGITKGISQGDPGNWDLEGTNGPQFVGQNADAPIVVDVDSPLSSFSIQCARSGGSSNGMSITATALDASDGVVDTASTVVGEINEWSTFALSGSGIVSVSIESAGSGYSPFGCDNMVLVAAAAPTTTTAAPGSTTSTTAAPGSTTSTTAAPGVQAVTVTPAFTG